MKQKKQWRRFLSFIFAVCLLGTSSIAFAIPEREENSIMRVIGVRNSSIEFSIDSNGYTNNYGEIDLTTGYTAEVTLTLKRMGAANEIVKSWSDSGRNVIIDEGWYVTSGYFYQLFLEADIYGPSGTLVDHTEIMSQIEYY